MDTIIPLSRKDLIFHKDQNGGITGLVEAFDLRLIPIDGGAFGPLFPDLVRELKAKNVREAFYFVRGARGVRYPSMIDWLATELVSGDLRTVCRDSYRSGQPPQLTDEQSRMIRELVRTAISLALDDYRQRTSRVSTRRFFDRVHAF